MKNDMFDENESHCRNVIYPELLYVGGKGEIGLRKIPAENSRLLSMYHVEVIC